MLLILIAALGIAFGRRAVGRRIFLRIPSDIVVPEVHITPLASTGHFWTARRQLSARCRIVAGSALLMSVLLAGLIELRSQTNVPAKSVVGAEFYLKRGEDYSDAHQYDRAIADYTTALELKPDYAEAYNNRGFAYYLKGDFDQAIKDYTRAIELRPNYPKAYNSRGVVYMTGGYGAAKSVPDFDRAIELKPDFRYAYINRANARLFSHPRLALQDFHQAGMYPERTVTILASVFIGAAAITVRVLRRRNLRVRGASRDG